MRIIKSRGVLILSRKQTCVLEGRNGPDAEGMSRYLRRKAKELAESTGQPVEVYAAKSRGGYMITQVLPEEWGD